MTAPSMEDLLIQHKRFMMYRAFRIVGDNYHDAEDLVSETMLLALTKIEDWNKQTCKFTSWIKWRMLDAAKYFRFGCHTPQVKIYQNDAEDLHFNVPDLREGDADLMLIIGKLPYPKLAVMNEQGYFDREIAAAFGVSRPTIHKWHKANKEHYEVLMQ